MNTASRKALIKTAVDMVIDHVEETGSFTEVAGFLKHFTYIASARAKGSCGGTKNSRPFIQISLCDRHFDAASDNAFWKGRVSKTRVWKDRIAHAQRDEWLFVEYSHVHNDSEIGKFVSDDPFHHVLGVVCHEVAHAIQRWIDINTFGQRTKPHGKEWQDIYRDLRTNLLNPLLNENVALAAETKSTGDKPMTKKTASKKQRTKAAAAKAKSKKTASKKTASKKKSTKKSNGAVAQVWAICEKNKTGLTNGTTTRKEVIEACIKAGLNPATAATQYQRWKKATYK